MAADKRFVLVLAAMATAPLSFAAAPDTKEPPVKPAAPSTATYSDSGVKPAPQEWADEIKQPTDWFKWGADLRLRQEFHENAITLDNQAPDNIWSYQRYRARVWASLKASENISINNRWTWEGRYWWEPAPRQGFEESYIIADQLNLQAKDLGGSKSTITVGRQDIILNDGWLVLEGTPLDGSRTIFFDAARVQYQVNPKQSVDVAVLATHSDADDWSPIIMSDDEAKLVEQDEVGAYLDYRWNPSKATQYDAYFIYKHDKDPIFAPRLGDQGDIYTFGGRADHSFTENIRGRVEAAYQFGDRQNGFTPSTGEMSAFGVTSRATYAFKDQMDNKLHLSFEFLSGDNPSTNQNEAFDPLWGRWPQFSELYVYTVASETRIAEVTNIYRIGPTWEVLPNQRMNISMSYYALFADERTYAGSPGFGDGYFRGQLVQAFFRYKFNRYLAGHLWGEYFIPGDYYSNNRDDNAVFLRAELSLTF